MKRLLILSAFLVGPWLPLAVATQSPPLDLGTRLELFVDRTLVERTDGVTFELQQPIDAGEVLRFNKPWEGPFAGYCTVIRDGARYRLYYRGLPEPRADGSERETTCVAESPDGITWTRPELDLFEVDGHRRNNVVLAGQAPFSHNFSPLLDDRPGVPADQRYKALAGTQKTGLYAFVSADGWRWRKLVDRPVITEGDFDSQNVAFWSPSERQYLAYVRVFRDRIRRIARTTSTDFTHWTAPVLMGYGDGPLEHLYTNQTHPYFRAPQIYLGIAARFLPGRQVLTAAQAEKVGVNPGYFRDLSDSVLITTRGGDQYDRQFPEAFLKPELGLENWTSRTNYPALNLVPTGEAEMSLYVQKNYGHPTHHLRRYRLRTDGLVAVRAPWRGGELLTRPLRFSGRRLRINFATSAAGEIRVEIQDEAGRPLPGFTLDDSLEQIGNEIAREVTWKNGADLATLAGRPIRLRFVMKDAELYSIQFRTLP
ncbi:MAG: hypothetical protein ACOYNR_09495 [Blastocatellia bacterium]